MKVENSKKRTGKTYKLVAGTALSLGISTFGAAAHADELPVSNEVTSTSQVVNTGNELVTSDDSGQMDTGYTGQVTTDNNNETPGNTPDETGSNGENSEGTGNSGDDSSVTPPDETKPTEPSTPPTPPSTPDKPKPTPPKPSAPSSPSKPKPASPKPSAPSKTVSSSTKAVTSHVSSHSETVVSSYANSAYYQSSTVGNSKLSNATSIYTGPVLKKIEAAQPIKKIDTSSPEAFIKSIAPRVQVLAGKNNLFASIILAQAILESGYGQSNMAQKYFNIFNITGAYLGKSVTFQTQEFAGTNPYFTQQSFRVYSNYDQSLDDYINLMLKGTTWNPDIYAGSWKSQAKTYQEAAESLQGVFATDPDYAQKLIDIIQEYNLNFYDNVDSSTQVWASDTPASPVLSSKMDTSNFPAYNGVEYPGSESYAFGNCTQYVYNRIIQLGGQIGTHMGNGGEWGINAQAQGYYTTTVPTEGYAVSFPPGVAGSSSVYGHVAFVEKVYSDNSILVSEMNVKGNNIVSERHISAGVAALATYIQPK